MADVRTAQLSDLETIVQFNLALAEESEGKVLDREILRAGVRRALQSPDLCRYFVAESHGEPVGQTMVTYELSDWRDGVIWWIQSVYVASSSRKQGVFGSLFRHIEAAARADRDARGLRLYVHDENTSAIETYRRLGMPRGQYSVCEKDWSGAVRPV